jgi:hypothetical protein
MSRLTSRQAREYIEQAARPGKGEGDPFALYLSDLVSEGCGEIISSMEDGTDEFVAVLTVGRREAYMLGALEWYDPRESRWNDLMPVFAVFVENAIGGISSGLYNSYETAVEVAEIGCYSDYESWTDWESWDN